MHNNGDCVVQKRNGLGAVSRAVSRAAGRGAVEGWSEASEKSNAPGSRYRAPGAPQLPSCMGSGCWMAVGAVGFFAEAASAGVFPEGAAAAGALAACALGSL